MPTLPTTIRCTNRTTIALELSPSGLLIRAPYHMTEHEIKAFLDSKSAWIEKHYQIMQGRQRQQREEPQNQLSPFTMEEIEALADKALEVIPKKVKFYAEIGKILPEYPKHRKWLKENGGRYLSRLP